MTTLTSHVLANAVGKRYSYLVRVRGLPVVWTDGRGNWTTGDLPFATPYPSIHKGGLAKTNWSFGFESNPLEPLSVGTGINIELICDHAGVTRRLFAPTIEVDRWEVDPLYTVGADESNIEFVSTSATPVVGVDYYMGLETVRATVENWPTMTLDRGLYGMPPRRIVPYYDGDSGAYENTVMTTYPTVWRGRYVDIIMGEVLDDGSIGEVWSVWAGHLESFDITSKSVRLSVESLTTRITKDYWPRALGECSTGTDTSNYYVRQDQFYLVTDAFVEGGRVRAGIRKELGVYNTSGVFTRVNTTGWYTLEQLAQMLRDTLVYVGVDEFGGSGAWATIYNALNVYVENASDDTRMRYTNDNLFGFTVTDFGPLNVALPSIRPTSNDFLLVLFGTTSNGYVIDRYASMLQGLPNDSRFYPSVDEGCRDVNDDMLAYVAISNGDDTELVSVDVIVPQSDGIINMSVVERGLGGTRQRAWGGLVDGEPRNVTLKQVCAVRTGESMSVADVLLYLLTSVDGASGGVNGSYDILGPATGLGIPEDLVDTEGIRARLAIGDIPKPTLFWIDKAGGGKDVLENFLKLNGVYLVTRRFVRGGVSRFGLSADVVDVPAPTRWDVSITDSHILASEEPRVNINERLTINQVAISPRYEFGKEIGDTGGKRYAYAEQSIKKYGAAKALEIEASAIYSSFSSYFTGNYIDEADIATAIATAAGLRWFGAYSDGNFTINANMPHVGWAIQAGDRVMLSITNIASPDGTLGYTGVAKVMDVKHKHGDRPGADVTLRVNTAQGVELAPSFRVASYSGSNITLSANEFSLTGDGVQPPFDGDTSPPRDAQWFNYARHGAGLTVTVWEQGNYASRQTRTVTATSGNVLTLSSNLGGTLQSAITAGNVKVIGTFGDYATPISTLRGQYAYVGNNDAEPVIGDGTAIEAPAKRWL